MNQYYNYSNQTSNYFFNNSTFNINQPIPQKPICKTKYCSTEVDDDEEENEKDNCRVRVEKRNGSRIYHIKCKPGSRVINLKI